MNGPLLKKSFDFAVRIMKLHCYLQASGNTSSPKQLVIAGTSIGANAEEANGAMSKADFGCEISIAYKEVRETSYWLRLLYAAGYLELRLFESIHQDCQELCRILFAILRTSGRA